MSTSPLSPEEIRAAAEVHRELGPEYNDAVVASFLEKIDREVAARVDARLAATPSQAQPAMPDSRRALLKGIAIGAVVTASSLLAAMSGNNSEGERRFLVVIAIWLVVAVGYAVGVARTRQQPASRRTAPGR